MNYMKVVRLSCLLNKLVLGVYNNSYKGDFGLYKYLVSRKVLFFFIVKFFKKDNVQVVFII